MLCSDASQGNLKIKLRVNAGAPAANLGSPHLAVSAHTYSKHDLRPGAVGGIRTCNLITTQYNDTPNSNLNQTRLKCITA